MLIFGDGTCRYRGVTYGTLQAAVVCRRIGMES